LNPDKLHLLQHPLAAHIVTHLRDKTTKHVTFRTLCNQLATLLAIEATRDLPTQNKHILTPLEPTTGQILDKAPLVVVPILRAGMSMVQPFLDMFPETIVGTIGLERDHVTAQPRTYYAKLPPLAGRHVFVVDPMLATGGSACEALRLVKLNGAERPKLLCIVAAPEGLAEVARAHPDVTVHTAALDRCRSDKKYILPGLGDFGDRLYGT
jgi:uracil phosphoribosyltransferase